MQHIIHNEQYDTAVLIKTASLQKNRIEDAYIKPTGLKAISFSLDYAGKKKPSATTIKEYLETLLPSLDKLGIKDLLVCDGEYFKKLCKVQKADPYYGYVLPVAIKGYEHMNAVLCPNHSAVMFNPAMQDKIDLAITTMVQHKEGAYTAIGEDIIHFEEYPKTYEEIKNWLSTLHQYPSLTADIEAYSLKHHNAGIGTISFAWSKHEGIAFSVDTTSCDPTEIQVWDKADKKYKKRIAVNKRVTNEPVRALLKEFFETYQGQLIWHNASYDLNVLIYQLWMDNLIDRRGLLTGLDVMTSKVEDTKLITYLATNSCTGNHLGLKDQAHEFTGNYAESDINDIRLIPEPDLLKYNLVDALATWYVMDKHYDTMVRDDQLPVYEMFKGLLKDILDMQLTGICLDMGKVLEAEATLSRKSDEAISYINSTQVMQQFSKSYAQQEQLREFNVRKDKAKNPDGIKIKPIEFFLDKPFNPNSGKQVQALLYDHMELPVIDLTDTGQPAVGGSTLGKLVNHVDNIPFLTPDEIEEYKGILQALLDFVAVDKILGTFITAYKESPKAPDGMHYLYGNFNLGGTKSGRLSSSGPNLQNQPSTGSPYAKLIKKCFVAPKGWIAVTLDYNSLEDYISALTTKDKNKLKVYTDGFCGHCLRASFYFKDEMPDIDSNDPKSVNSIKKKYPHLRQKSKIPTFLLTYGGSWKGIVDSLGFEEEEAKRIEANYHELYVESDKWVADKIQEASIKGYVELAFGLRLRTPILKKSILNSSKTTAQAGAESRTAGNALGQSWGLLNSRAGQEFMAKVRASEYRLDIRPMAQIHDSQYFLVRDDIDVVDYVNEHLVKAVQWQEDPLIAHDTVKLGGETSLLIPSWADEVDIPNGASKEEIIDICIQEAKKRNE